MFTVYMCTLPANMAGVGVVSHDHYCGGEIPDNLAGVGVVGHGHCDLS
jgi:hypothetical protein